MMVHVLFLVCLFHDCEILAAQFVKYPIKYHRLSRGITRLSISLAIDSDPEMQIAATFVNGVSR